MRRAPSLQCSDRREVCFLGASAMVFEGIPHPRTLEALACRESLDLVENLSLGPVKVVEDSMVSMELTLASTEAFRWRSTRASQGEKNDLVRL
jgi:hypothetical protein